MDQINYLWCEKGVSQSEELSPSSADPRCSTETFGLHWIIVLDLHPAASFSSISWTAKGKSKGIWMRFKSPLFSQETETAQYESKWMVKKRKAVSLLVHMLCFHAVCSTSRNNYGLNKSVNGHRGGYEMLIDLIWFQSHMNGILQYKDVSHIGQSQGIHPGQVIHTSFTLTHTRPGARVFNKL